MLQTIRENSQGIIAKVIIGLIIITFALWGIQSLVSLTNRKPAPATVNGEKITPAELNAAMQSTSARVNQAVQNHQMPATALDPNNIEKLALQKLINDKVLTEAAEDRKMTVPTDMVDQLIVSDDNFADQSGNYSPEIFKGRLASVGLTPMGYRNELKRAQLINQLQAGYASSEFVLPQETKQLLALDSQTRDIEYTTLTIDPAKIEVSEQEIQKRYDEKASELVTPEQVALNYVMLDKSQLAARQEISDDEIQGAYQQLVESFKGKEQRDVAHILFPIEEGKSADDVLKQVQQVRADIEAGKISFAEAAKKYSSDLGSASKGGDLGFQGRDLLSQLDDSLAESAFSLGKGDLSQPVKTPFGYHLLTVKDIRKTNPPKLAEVRQKLRNQLADQKAESAFAGAHEQLADLTFSADDLKPASDELKLPIQSTGLFDSNGAKSGVASNPKVIAAAFSDDLLKNDLNSDIIDLDSTRSVVVHVKTHHEPHQQTLAEVHDQLKRELQQEKAKEQISAKAEKLVADLQAGKSLSEVDSALSWKQANALVRNNDKLDRAIVEKAFAMPKPDDKPTFAVVNTAPTEAAIVGLKAVKAGDRKISDDEQKSLQMYLAHYRGQQVYQQLVDKLQSSAEIEKAK